MKTIGLALFLACVMAPLAEAGPAMSWNTDEPTHARLLKQGLTGQALKALEDVLVAQGFHVESVKLSIGGTAVPSMRQGTLDIAYETTVQQPQCQDRAPCRPVTPRRVLINLACDQWVTVGTNRAPTCDGVRGLSLVPQS